RTAILRDEEDGFYDTGWRSGSFRVEEFRVPMMKAIIQPPKEPLINAQRFDLDIMVMYLSGGGASNAPVKLRNLIQPRHIKFEDYEGIVFANGPVKEGIFKTDEEEARDELSSYDVDKSRKPDMRSKALTLDKSGALRTSIDNLPVFLSPRNILTELEFKDPNGEIQTVSSSIPIYPSGILLGIKPDSWALSKDGFKFHVIALDISGKAAPDTDIKVNLFQKSRYSHRKRLIGGFYSYENMSEIKRLGQVCEGRTDKSGILICEIKTKASGNVILQAQGADKRGNISIANQDVWVAGEGDWWFSAKDSDRIDILPEKKRYEPGETARFHVRMPFRDATLLVSVEREGIMDTYVKKVSGRSPVIDIPIKDNYAPNVYISALCVRGRVGDIKPTALIDLGKPAFKLGIAEIKVGWRGHELKVKVSPEKNVYKVRDKARVRIKVTGHGGAVPPKGTEIAIAAVDEGLLELMPNKSWNILEAMMLKRGYGVQTSTAQMHVVGKRHFGLKALPQGGGGGRTMTRELFDTLLLWKGRVVLNDSGEAEVDIPLNDSLTSFRIAAIANGGAKFFGSGHASIRTTQDLMILSGLPDMVREGDRFRAGFTIRNASDRRMEVDLSASLNGVSLKTLTETLDPAEAKETGWEVSVPYGVEHLNWELAAREKGGSGADDLKKRQKVSESIRERVFQATIAQVDSPISIDVEIPKGALPQKGGVKVLLRPRLADGLDGVIHYMKNYPYTCMEQKASRAIALKDERAWKKIVSELPSSLDSQGLVKYFPLMPYGSDTLTSYLLSISHEAGWEIPEAIRKRMIEGLKGFIEGKVTRHLSVPAADLTIRKLAALEALSRYNADKRLIESINIEPNTWPISGVIDWMNILLRMKDIPNRDKRLKEAEHIMRSRLNFQGTRMGFSTERTDSLWWLMVSGDVNAVRAVIALMNIESWKEDIPRLVIGAISRQRMGRWDTTTANAWGVLAMEGFSKRHESASVSGETSARLGGAEKRLIWEKTPKGGMLTFNWPSGKESLGIQHHGTGKPWAAIHGIAAAPLKEPFSSGYKIKKTILPVEQKEKSRWTKGDVIRIRLEIEAQADMTWIVVDDPIPAGASILGSGLGRDSGILTAGEKKTAWTMPAFEERAVDSFRAYYEFAPKGGW
ncbi:MAG: alpha-2-macroglobulin, partial [Nitrospirae bacterium]|nr:alpha-2-macroglobulin [Nitrospirota bacterium]